MIKPFRLAIALSAIALVAAACGETADAETTPPSSPTSTTTSVAPATEAPASTDAPGAPGIPVDYEGFRAQPTACGAEAPDPVRLMEFEAPEDQALDPEKGITAVIETSCGNIVVRLDPAAAPETVNSFVFLAREGYFDGSASHRIAPGFVLQAGDPTATGIGGPGYVLPDEFPPEDFVYEQGVLAMANAGPGTTGSQFFIMLSDSALPPQFSVFGTVVDGLETLDAIAAIPLGDRRTAFGVETSVPLETLYLERITVQDG